MKKKRTSAHWTNPEIRILLDYYEQKGPDFGLRYKGPAIGRFQKGHIPRNKGKKMSAEQYEKTKATMFKHGDRPENRMPIGHETTRADGYTYVKQASNPTTSPNSPQD